MLVVVYTGFVFTGFHWMLKAKIEPIEKIMTNHITETNKKIDNLRQDMKDGFKEIKELIKK